MAETELRLNFLGDLEVIRDGEVLPLPPSKKTRALLAYLAMNPRPLRREHLCELLWEIPDDPRGGLRWSLSKLRALVDSEHCQRIAADRSHVRFDGKNTCIDVHELLGLAATDLEQTDIATLRQAADTWNGNFLDSLELTNFYGFYAWCAGEREKVTQARARILNALVTRLAGEPEQALPYARAQVINTPYDEGARAGLIRLLLHAGRTEEAEQQVALGNRLLKEIGIEHSQQLLLALRSGPGQSRPRPEAAAPALTPVPTPPAARAPIPAPTTSPASTTATTLAGRERETAQLANVFTQARQSCACRLVLVSGPPGIGKSRLLDAAAAMAGEAGATLLRGNAVASETLRPFALWLDALHGQSAKTAEAVFAGAASANREQLMAGIASHVSTECVAGPVAILFDDFQWADESSANALNHLVSAARRLPLLIVITVREGELADNSAALQVLQGLEDSGMLEEIRLGPLAEDAVLDIIGLQGGSPETARLCRECGGNPLLAIELARALASGGDYSSLNTMIRARLARFDPVAVEVLRWAAVLGSRIQPALLGSLAGMAPEAVGQALELAERNALVVPLDYGLRFSHDLVAASIYNEISPVRRRVMHRKVAELLERETALDLRHAADLAHHASLSGDAALATRALVSAGRLCLRFFANQEARRLANKGLQLAEQLGEADRICLTLDFHDILLTAAPVDDWEAAAREYSALAEKALDHGAVGHGRLGYTMASYVRWFHGHGAGAREASLQAERITRGGSEEEHIVGMAEAAKCLALLEQDLPRADAMLMEAEALASRKRININTIAAARGLLCFHENRLDEAEEFFSEARALAKSSGERIDEFLANEYLVMIDIERGRFREALERSRELVSLAEKLREGSEAPFAHAVEALCRYALEDCAEALNSAVAELRIADAKHRLAYVLNRAAELDNAQGRPQSAISRASEALHCARVLERNTETLLALLALARAHRQQSNQVEYQANLNAIAALEQAPVAAWARQRAQPMLAEEN